MAEENFDYNEIFERLDLNHSGFIEPDELDAVLTNLGLVSAEQRSLQVPQIIAQMDSDGDGKVSRAEFIEAMQTLGGDFIRSLVGATESAKDEEVIDEELSRRLKVASKMFDKVDADRSGAIEEKEVELLLEGLGLRDPGERKRQTRKLMGLIDASGDGEVTRAEFLQSVKDGIIPSVLFEEAAPEEEAKDLITKASELFDKIDEDGSGSIDENELCVLLKGLGVVENLEARAEALMEIIDEDGSGSVTRIEFLQAVQNGALKDYLGDGDDFGLDSEDELHSEVYGDHSDDEDDLGVPSSRVYGRMTPNTITKLQEMGVPEDKAEHLWTVFQDADIDGGGTIGYTELKKILEDPSVKKGNRRITSHYVHTVMKQIDTSGDGELDFFEFVQAFQHLMDDDESPMSALANAEITALSEDLDDREEKISSLTSEVNKLKSQLKFKTDEFNSQLGKAEDDAQREVNDLRDQLGILERLNHKLDVQNRELLIQLKSRRSSYHIIAPTETKDESVRLKTVAEEDYTMLSEQASKMRDDMEISNKKHGSEIDTLRYEVTTTTTQLTEAIETITKLQQQIDNQDFEHVRYLERHNEELLAEIEMLKKRLYGGESSSGGDVVTMTQNIVVEGADFKDLESARRSYNKLLRDFDEFKLQTTIGFRKAEEDKKRDDELAKTTISSLTAELTALKKAHAELNQSIDPLRKTNHDLSEEVNALKRTLVEMEGEFDSKLKHSNDAVEEANNKKLHAEEETLQVRHIKDEEINRLNYKILEIEQIMAMKKQIITVDGFTGTPEEVIARLQDTIRGLQEEKASQEKVRVSLNTSLRALELEKGDANIKLSKLEAEKEQLTRQCAFLSSEVTRLGGAVELNADLPDINDLRTQLAKLKAENEELASNLKAAKWGQHALKTEVDQLKAELMEEKTNGPNFRELKRLEAELARVKTNAVQLQNQVANLTNEIKAIRAEKENSDSLLAKYRSKVTSRFKVKGGDDGSVRDNVDVAGSMQDEVLLGQLDILLDSSSSDPQLESMQSEIISVQERLAKKEKEVAVLQLKSEDFQKTISSMTSEKDQMERDMKLLRQKLLSPTSDPLILQENQSLISQVVILKAEKANLENELLSVKALSAKKSDNPAERAELESLRVRVTSLEQEKAKLLQEAQANSTFNLDLENQALRGENVTLRSKITRLEESERTFKTQLDALRVQASKVTILQEEIASLNRKNGGGEVEILRSKNSLLQEQIDKLKLELELAKSSSVRNISLQSRGPDTLSAETKAEIERLNLSITILKTQQGDHEAEITSLRNKLAVAQAELDGTRSTLDSVKRSADDARRQAQLYQGRIDRAEKARDESDTRVSDLEVENAQLKARLESSAAPVSNQVVAQLSALRDQVSRLTQEKRGLDDELQRLHKSTSDQDQQIRELRGIREEFQARPTYVSSPATDPLYTSSPSKDRLTTTTTTSYSSSTYSSPYAGTRKP